LTDSAERKLAGGPSDAQQFPKPKERFATVKNPKDVQPVVAHFSKELTAATDQAGERQSFQTPTLVRSACVSRQ
jgi:hypothetical protein